MFFQFNSSLVASSTLVLFSCDTILEGGINWITAIMNDRDGSLFQGLFLFLS